MKTVLIKKISYGQLEVGGWLVDNDRYGLAAFINDNMKNMYLKTSL